MVRFSPVWCCCLATLLVLLTLPGSLAAITKNEKGWKSAVFLSPKVELKPGSVSNKIYYNIDFPKGNIAVKSFNAEVVDEQGVSVPLHETYLHHWVVFRYHQRIGVEVPKYTQNLGFHQSDFNLLTNSGPCQNSLGQYYGLGSETRRTPTDVPDPYGLEVGNPSEIPPGYEERWLLNIHAIDTRGVEDRLGCTECRCDLYNVTIDEYDRPLRPGYIGGLKCCYDEVQCRLRQGFQGLKRNIYMKYTIEWVDWDSSLVPVRAYIFDVTDLWKKTDSGVESKHHCLIEYQVESCSDSDLSDNGCVDTKRVSLTMPKGGVVVYGVAHQHTGGVGSTLYGEGGRVICSSMPTYGDGKEAGNEAGYIVGMSTCYPEPGSVTISDGETLVLESHYNASKRHTGVMGLFYIMVADAPPKVNSLLHAQKQESTAMPIALWGVVVFGIAIVIAVALAYHKTTDKEDVYQPIAM